MNTGELSLLRRCHCLRARVAGLVVTALLLALVSSSTSQASSLRTPLGQSIDLCAPLPSGPDFEVNPGIGENGKFQSCSVYDEHPYPYTERKFFTFSIFHAGSASQAQAHVEYNVNSPSLLGERWRPTTEFGDPGFGFILPAVPPTDPNNPSNTQASAKLIFARGCYVASGDAGWHPYGDYHLYDDSAIRQMAASVDAALRGAACSDSGTGAGGSTQPTEPTQPTETATSTATSTATGTATPEADVDLVVDHIEVVQVIQQQGNEIPLVAGKKTVVRVFLQASSKSGNPGPYLATASAYLWPEGGSEVELKASPRSVVVRGDTLPNRNATDGSINFVIPPEMAGHGVFSLRIVVNPEHQLPETSYENNEITEPFEFVQRNGLRVGYIRIGYKPPLEATFSWPKSDLTKYDPLLRKLLPAPEAGVQYYEMPWRVRASRSASTETLGADLNLYLRQFYDQLGADRPDILIGWLSSEYSQGFEYGGLAEAADPGYLGRVAIVLDYQRTYSEETLAHEVGHDLGLKHTGTKGDPNPPCRISKNYDASYWPSEYGDSAAIKVLGFDTVKMQVVPETHYDIMSYCTPDPWISAFHYRNLFDQNVKPATEYGGSTIDNIIVRGWGWVRGGGGAPRFELVRPAGSGTGGASSPSKGLNISTGSDYGPGSANSLILSLKNAGRISATTKRQGTGSYCLRFIDANGAALYERCFDPVFEDQESLEQRSETGFVLAVPNPGNFTQVDLIHHENGQEQEIASIEKSSHPPMVTVTSPKGGDRWEGEHTIEWAGSDEDGDSLRYDIHYSSDGKKSWYPLEVDSHETSYTFSTEEILPSDQTYIRVLASDGFDTTHADVGPLVVPKQPDSPEPPPPPPVLDTGGAITPGSSTGSQPGSLLARANVWVLALAAAGAGLLLILGIFILSIFVIIRRKPQAQPAQWPNQGPAVPTVPRIPSMPPRSSYDLQAGPGQPPEFASTEALICPYPDCMGQVVEGQNFCNTCGRSLDPLVVAAAKRAWR